MEGSTAQQKFIYGYEATTETQQMIAFWTHTIDTFASILEYDTNIYDEDVSQFNTFEACDINNIYSYMGAVRSGFRKSIRALPTEVRVPVEEYFKKRLKRTSELVPEDIMEIDLLLGTGDPFKYDNEDIVVLDH